MHTYRVLGPVTQAQLHMLSAIVRPTEIRADLSVDAIVDEDRMERFAEYCDEQGLEWEMLP